MPFAFSTICTLLQRLEDVELHQPPLLNTIKAPKIKAIVESWFKSHRRPIDELDVAGGTAFLSTLLPERRTDRVYGIQTTSLCRTLGRVLGLPVSGRADLEAYKRPHSGDLAICLERVMKARGYESSAQFPVHVEEVDDMLSTLAGHCRFSDPSFIKPPPGSDTREAELARIINRLSPLEGKWLARLILKCFKPIFIDEFLILKNFHFLLPDLLRFQQDFGAAMLMLKGDLKGYHSNPDPRSQKMFKAQASEQLRPRVGTKVSRPMFHKARGLDYCVNTMLGKKEWVVERKYDGEYCEIHVDLTKSSEPRQCIQIFSKSGKDSTADRQGLHATLIDCLRLGKPNCRFKKQAIFLGELVVFSDKDDCVLPFEKIRKHVARSGVKIGADADSQAHAHEHLAIVFFDLLLLDDEVVMNKPARERRDWLRESYRKKHGRALGAEWTVVNFGSSQARRQLGQQFTMSITQRCEGLVLKPNDMPYFSMDHSPNDYNCSFIKLKKDYIDGMGDEEDFAVIGASYDAQKIPTGVSKAVQWTTYHLGCLTNKEEVRRVDARPIFRHVGTIDQEHCIPKAVLEAVSSVGKFLEQPFTADERPKHFDIEWSSPAKMNVVFDKPLVFEVLGSGFEKPSNCNYFMLRHPRVRKFHQDRTWMDCVTFQELQEHGRASREAPPDSESQETRRWLEKLESSCKKRVKKQASLSPGKKMTRSTTTPSTSLASAFVEVVSPAKPIADRTGSFISVPDSTSRTSNPASSPLQRPRIIERQQLTQKRCLDDACGGQRPQTKRQRSDDRREPDAPRTHPNTSSPLVELSSNTDAASQQRRTSDRSATVASLTRKLVSLVCPKTCSSDRTAQLVSIATCKSSHCAFSNTVVVLAPCIAAMPYVVENLLAAHHATIATDLAHWDRDSFSHPHHTETVSESQSYPGMRKVVLVESKRLPQVREMVQRIQELNQGKFRERVELYDWRVLEDCSNHKNGADCLKRHFIGATLFDDTHKKALFVAEHGYLQI